ncbi:putative leucine-rich repeat domain superfamily [Helianthus annuus]|nr:putative leucine-rich repeat domain superfamily [Helianthus annuus]KAJ0662214.1 putative leucine-rich repeat domain superfamily [Helianthus annuus]
MEGVCILFVLHQLAYKWFYGVQPTGSPFMKRKPPALVSLCLGIIGKHLDDIIEDLAVLTSFPPDIKMAVARRRKLLDDDVIIALAESSWEILDLSDSEVTDIGLLKVIEICKHVRAMDIRGCPRSEHTARSSLSSLKPTLNNVEEDSWEELDTTEIVLGAQSLRWLVWVCIAFLFFNVMCRSIWVMMYR